MLILTKIFSFLTTYRIDKLLTLNFSEYMGVIFRAWKFFAK